MHDILDALGPAERRAVALVALMIRLHGRGDGEGLFTGVGRYGVLQGRVRLAAVTNRTVGRFWDRMASAMRWPISAAAHDAAVLALIAPDAGDGDTLAALADRSESVIRLARQVARADRARGRGEAPPKPFAFDDPLDVFGALDAAQIGPDPGSDEDSSPCAPARSDLPL